MNLDTKKIDEIIVGRVIPHVYAFSTNTIPNYLKVGDTYRTVESRLKEWEHYFPHLNKEYEKEAVLNGANYFRDYSVHKFLETKKGKKRLQPSDLPNGVYYSNEFFKDTIKKDIDEAFEDINNDFNTHGNEYVFYDLLSKQQISTTFERNQDYGLRPNQKEVVDNFIKAINRKPKKEPKNLLMYAVMRFGKSFTSLCCAKAMDAKVVVVVSGKADVEIEWKQTAESHKFFEDYLFVTSKELKRDSHSISNALKKKKRVIVFLTLQDLSGKDIKDKHKEIFSKEIDLLIVDETHFAARAEEYGKVLQDVNIKEYKEDETLEEAEESYKYLSRKVTLHLSGTPYRLLMGSEFKKDDIICFCQFTDIIKEQSKWDEKWLLKDVYDSKDCEDFGKHIGDKVHEWDNPYYGFPQMVRFAFNPNKDTQKRLDQLKNNGESYAFSKLFRPQSIEKDDTNKHKEFVYEKEVLDLIKCIDGSKEDNNIFPFLNYEKIKNGKMCHHMVMVLPYCASCDAMEELLRKYKSEFKNLCEYEIINISGVDDVKKYKKTSDVVKAISEFEEAGKKTITLTVQRMLTGSTVKEWDTMIYLKDTSSPQEYDQAIFRLQNQYIETRVDEFTGDVVKINLKPQTLLIDFAPNRMFYMQEKKAQIYNANIDESGNKKLKDRINYELKISPIIVVNKDKLVEVEETDILEAISNYNYDRGISEEVKEVSIDLSILDNDIIRNVIESENEIDSKAGLEIKANIGDETKLDDGNDDEETDTKSGKNEEESSSNAESGSKENETTKLIKKIQNYYRRILLFAFLTKSKVASLDDIIQSINSNENKRILVNLGLKKQTLQKLRVSFKNKFALSSLDYKIQDLNSLSFSDLSNEDKVSVAISKFGKLGEAVVITPQKYCDEMIKLLGDDAFTKFDDKRVFVDIASVSGEFTLSIVKKLNQIGQSIKQYKSRIISIPKTSICYELTRKVYELFGLDVSCIISDFTAFDLLNVKNANNEIDYERIKKKIIKAISKAIKESDKTMNISAVVGNPPYQETIKEATEGNNKNAVDIYQHFQEIALKLSDCTCLIYPAKDIQRGAKNTTDRQLVYLRIYNGSSRNGEKHIPNEDSVFGDAVRRIPGDVGVFLYNKKQPTEKIIYQNIEINRSDKILPVIKEFLGIAQSLTPFANTFKFSKIRKVCESNFVQYHSSSVLNQPVDRNVASPSGYSKVLTNDKAGSGGKSKWYYIKTCDLDKEPVVSYKLIIPSARPNESFADSKNMEILSCDESFGRTKMCIYDSSDKDKVNSCKKYLSTKFAKVINLMTPDSFLYYLPDFDSLYERIDWTKSLDEIDNQLFELFKINDKDVELIKNINNLFD